MHEKRTTQRTETYRIAKELGGGSMVGLSRDQWARLIADCNPPTIEEVASELAARFDLDVEPIQEQLHVLNIYNHEVIR